MKNMPQEALDEVASYFKVLSEPTRLKLLNILREGERNVSELTHESGFAIANISKHLAVLMSKGFVSRKSKGTSVYYQIADESVYGLCDLVCGNIAKQIEMSAANRAVLLESIKKSQKPVIKK